MDRTVYFNGNIYTMNDEEACDYVIVKNGIIEKTGKGNFKEEDMNIFDLNGMSMFPGFIDSHNHMLTAGLRNLQIDLSDRNYDSIEKTLIDYQLKK